ncbi:heme exporter protein CcmB [Rheinheimera faecalis]|jgi:heme exporter protein B|uniref:heme exporter protein CcmB n=2 Tax=Rheinheimera TaxID=67575 RepID=UPI001E3F7526|nr:heme exporter protein CcmB [Rheinheimera faecalis]MBU0912174.1 heme exporter protein CcmB [Gammaproteobacteria bacterium]
MVMWRTLVKRELQLLGRQKADWLNPLVFFLLVLSLFPLGIGPEPGMLKQIAPGLVWIAALLSVLLSAERLFKDDYRYGVIEQLVAGRQGLFSYVTAKICCHWLSTGVPLVLVSPLIAVLLGLDWQSWQVLVVTLLLGTPVLSLLSVLGAALTMAADKGGILQALIILPLYIPLLIFASGAMEAAATALPYAGQLAVLLAFLLFALALVPLAVRQALRMNVG